MHPMDHAVNERVQFLSDVLAGSGQTGFVFGNSGGKDSALVGILCKMACENTLGVLMPCHTRRNYADDTVDAMLVAEQFHIQSRTVDLTEPRTALLAALGTTISDSVAANIAPRLRMTTLYAIAGAEGRLVVGTGNASEGYMGYFTKWGDGAYDVNPIADMTVTEIFAMLRYLKCPPSIIEKAPSGALFDGQTDEGEMGVTYKAIDHYLHTGEANAHDLAIIERYHRISEHKRRMPLTYMGR